jgi:hypothetical protein
MGLVVGSPREFRGRTAPSYNSQLELGRGNLAFPYPFVISYAVKIKVDTVRQNDMPACIVRLPSPTYPTH